MERFSNILNCLDHRTFSYTEAALLSSTSFHVQGGRGQERALSLKDNNRARRCFASKEKGVAGQEVH